MKSLISACLVLVSFPALAGRPKWLRVPGSDTYVALVSVEPDGSGRYLISVKQTPRNYETSERNFDCEAWTLNSQPVGPETHGDSILQMICPKVASIQKAEQARLAAEMEEEEAEATRRAQARKKFQDVLSKTREADKVRNLSQELRQSCLDGNGDPASCACEKQHRDCVNGNPQACGGPCAR